LYTNIVRHKAKLARSIPTSFLHHSEIYSLLSLPLVQTSHLVSSLSRNLNHIEFDLSFLKARLQQLQDSTWSCSSILIYPPIFPSSQLYTYTAQAILAIHKFNIQFLHSNNNWPIP